MSIQDDIINCRKAGSFSTDGSVIYRQIEKSDVSSVRLMLDRLYDIKRPNEFYSWIFHDTPVPSILLGVFCDDVLGGIFGMQKRILTNNVVCGQATGLNISSEWQGKGYFFKLGNLALKCFNDLDILCVFANSNARYACERSFGFKTIGVIKNMVLDCLEGIRDVCDIQYEPISANTVFHNFIDHNDKNTAFTYSQQYRIWRYTFNPIYSYAMVKIPSGEFAITKIFFDQATKAYFGDIVDFECSLDNEEKLRKLFLGACWNLKNKGVKAVTTWAMPGTLLKTVVEDIRFREDKQETYFEVKSLKPKYEYLYDFSRWHLRQADTVKY